MDFAKIVSFINFFEKQVMQNDPSPANDSSTRAEQLLAWRENFSPKRCSRKKRRPDTSPQKVGCWIQGRYPEKYARILEMIEEEKRAEPPKKPVA
ncbi:hypothetical protein [Hydrogenophaga sp.]|uniref:hypothetical protein n=1 Tax=Hydrogenophaga sp. TaxID=1904254 RepID=UPI0026038A06|nr:hypothetical protein [Hydrogenophaga sp.]MDM7948222.1 hypothetical protein [Hydrogenophaga sp.]